MRAALVRAARDDRACEVVPRVLVDVSQPQAPARLDILERDGLVVIAGDAPLQAEDAAAGDVDVCVDPLAGSELARPARRAREPAFGGLVEGHLPAHHGLGHALLVGLEHGVFALEDEAVARGERDGEARGDVVGRLHQPVIRLFQRAHPLGVPERILLPAGGEGSVPAHLLLGSLQLARGGDPARDQLERVAAQLHAQRLPDFAQRAEGALELGDVLGREVIVLEVPELGRFRAEAEMEPEVEPLPHVLLPRVLGVDLDGEERCRYRALEDVPPESVAGLEALLLVLVSDDESAVVAEVLRGHLGEHLLEALPRSQEHEFAGHGSLLTAGEGDVDGSQVDLLFCHICQFLSVR